MPQKRFSPNVKCINQKVPECQSTSHWILQYALQHAFFGHSDHNPGPGMSHTSVSHTQICTYNVILRIKFSVGNCGENAESESK